MANETKGKQGEVVHGHSSYKGGPAPCGEIGGPRRFSPFRDGITCAGCLKALPPIRLMAKTSDQGTACAEAVLCDEHDTQENRTDLESTVGADATGPWVDASENDAIACNVCGERGYFARTLPIPRDAARSAKL